MPLCNRRTNTILVRLYKVKKHFAMLRIRNGNKGDGVDVSYLPQHGA